LPKKYDLLDSNDNGFNENITDIKNSANNINNGNLINELRTKNEKLNYENYTLALN
jgi:hypothetical protein